MEIYLISLAKGQTQLQRIQQKRHLQPGLTEDTAAPLSSEALWAKCYDLKFTPAALTHQVTHSTATLHPQDEHSYRRLLVKSGKKASIHTHAAGLFTHMLQVGREAAGQTQGPETKARGDPRGQREGQQPQAWSGWEGGGSTSPSKSHPLRLARPKRRAQQRKGLCLSR